jgi:hypothetical protein
MKLKVTEAFGSQMPVLSPKGNPQFVAMSLKAILYCNFQPQKLCSRFFIKILDFSRNTQPLAT